MNTPKYRHEIKHFINYSDYLQIRNRLKHIASIDTSSTSNGRYKIRSLYFDNLYDKVLMENINGFNKRKYQLLKPKIIVDYVREAFVYEPGNVRITFDMDVRTGIYSNNIFNPSLPVAPTNTNLIILEVKYDEFLPEIINNVIQTNSREVTTISKYASSRIYG